MKNDHLVHPIDNLGVITLDGTNEAPDYQGFYQDFLKRVVDVLWASAAIVACFPVFLLICLAISLETPGLPIFRQLRIGRDGKPFYMYKLRTMYDGAHNHGFKTDHADPRITRIGSFLRHTKIDELPQLFNVIRSEMSLIGPRPLSTQECQFIINEVGISPQHPGFYPTVRPGLTGLEQIYRIHPLVYRERFRWNDYYERKVSLTLDLKVLYATMARFRLVCLATIFGGILELVILFTTIVR